MKADLNPYRISAKFLKRPSEIHRHITERINIAFSNSADYSAH